MKLIALILCLAASLHAAELRIGSSTVSITPDKPVALAGQFGTRISQSVEAPIIASAVAIESVEGGKSAEQSILISCDLVGIHHSVLAQFRQHLKPLLPDVDVRKVIVSATHTHTAPVTSEIPEETLITYPIPKEGVMQPAEYTSFLVERLAQAAVQAWKSRKPGGVSWTLGFAQIGENRRSVFADGHAQMYAKTNDARRATVPPSPSRWTDAKSSHASSRALSACRQRSISPASVVAKSASPSSSIPSPIPEATGRRGSPRESCCAKIDVARAVPFHLIEP